MSSAPSNSQAHAKAQAAILSARLLKGEPGSPQVAGTSQDLPVEAALSLKQQIAEICALVERSKAALLYPGNGLDSEESLEENSSALTVCLSELEGAVARLQNITLAAPENLQQSPLGSRVREEIRAELSQLRQVLQQAEDIRRNGAEIVRNLGRVLGVAADSPPALDSGYTAAGIPSKEAETIAPIEQHFVSVRG